MKIGAMLLLAFLVSSPAWALSCPRGDESPQISYDEADVVALVRLIGEPRDNGFSGEFEVIRSWKAALPKRINIMKPLPWRNVHSVGTCSYHFKYQGRYILYLTREEDGTFSTWYGGPLNLHEFEDVGSPYTSESNGRRAFYYRLRELENADRCGCGYEQGSFDTESLRKRADVITEAYVKRTWRKGAASYAELKLVSQDVEKKYNDPFSAKWPSLIVVTEDGYPDCGYPVTVEPAVEIEKKEDRTIVTLFSHYFYLHYDRNTEKKHSITGYSTNICSGNKPVTKSGFRLK